jgi:hypothetical protein
LPMALDRLMTHPRIAKHRQKIPLDGVEYFAFRAPDGFVVAAMMRGVMCVRLEQLPGPEPGWPLILKWVAHLKGMMRRRLEALIVAKGI